MSCLNPVRVPSKAIGATSRMWMTVPCGKCVECLKARQHSWVYRLERTDAEYRFGYFITLTYDPASVPLLLTSGEVLRYNEYIHRKSIEDCDMTLHPKDLQNYFKRLRKIFSFVYYCCGEYGDQFGRPHYHSLLWTNDINNARNQDAIIDKWQYGDVQIEPIIPARIYYCTKYINKSSVEAAPNDVVYPCFQRSSHGLGLKGFVDDKLYHDKYIDSDNRMETVQLASGEQIPVPRYFRKQFFQDDYTIERQQKIELQQEKSQKDEFKSYLLHAQIKTRKSSIESIISSYLQDRDFEHQRLAVDSLVKRRKGL